MASKRTGELIPLCHPLGLDAVELSLAAEVPDTIRVEALVKTAGELYLATDEDREGEAISWHLYEILQPKIPVKRLVFHEITDEAIHEALENPRGIDEDRLKKSIDIMVDALSLPRTPTVSEIWNPSFLPPRAELPNRAF